MQGDAASSVVYEAYKAYRKGRFLEVLALLDSPALSSTRDPYSIILCAMACLQLNKFARVEELMSKAGSIAPQYPLYNQLKAFLYLKAAPDFESALLYYGELLAKIPSDRILVKSLARLRRVKNFEEFQRNARIDDFVALAKPNRKLFERFSSPKAIKISRKSPTLFEKNYFSKRVKRFIFIITSLIFIAVIAFFSLRGTRVQCSKAELAFHTRFDEIEQVTLDGSGFDLIERITKKKQPEYYYNSESLQEDFRASKQLIKSGRLNEALKKINKIIHSNANMSVRERASFLKRFIIAIEDRQWEEISYSEIMKNPHLYGGYSLQWKGKSANVKKRQTAIVFNLLVDYRATDQFTGMAEVYCEQCGETIKNGDMVVVKGLFMDVITAGTPYLKGREIEISK